MDRNIHILFVDDDENILRGLKRGMRRHRKEWDMSFASNGEDALGFFKEKPVDIIVSDMRMPKMDGAELLERVRQLSPDTARVILSGYAKDEVVLKVVGPAHQYLAKPCDFEVIEDTIRRILRLRNCIGESDVRTILTARTSIPALPKIYQDLLKELENNVSTNKSIAAILEKDIALKAQVLKVCNSAFFGLPQTVGNLETAVSLIGFNTLKSLALLEGFFHTLRERFPDTVLMERLSANSVEIAVMARHIAKKSGLDEKICDQVSSAGSLSHIGTLLIASVWPQVFAKAAQACDKAPGQTIDWFEREAMGVDHGVIGGYLLGLWGFPLGLCEAVAYHHRPEMLGDRKHPVLACVHMAQHFTRELARGNKDMDTIGEGLDIAFLGRQDVLIAPEELDLF